MRGKIRKAIAGFFYVDVGESGIYKCRARGIFRKDGVKPLTGDDAEIEITHEGDREGNVTFLYERKNMLLRPPVANVDQALILFAMRTPDPALLLLDRFLIAAGKERIPCVICFNKADLAAGTDMDRIRSEYRDCGAPVHFISIKERDGVDEVREILRGQTTVLAGPSGAGKSSLTNAVQTGTVMETGEISKKLARGKNTTRHCELIYVEEDTWLCDTPGFTALDTFGIEKEQLDSFYPEFEPYRDGCYFQGCAHIHEPDCRVKSAVADGRVSRVRYENYAAIYEDLKEQERRKYR